eukprot:GHVQ01037648.1.p1 GENE.GHVQ01037648.1~~GHVQ01037648.1.p1  ORF type:complete len:1582 (+),score=151.70 GHVQ01037648.1:212-4957(+)
MEPASLHSSNALMTDFLRKMHMKSYISPQQNNYVVNGVEFGILSSEDVRRFCELRVYNRQLYVHLTQKAHPYGVLDPRLGVMKYSEFNPTTCVTCGLDGKVCPGHWGYLSLHFPVFHVGFFKYLLQILYCVCKKCASLLLPDGERQSWLSRMRRSSADPIVKRVMFKRVVERSKKQSRCDKCGERQGMLRRVCKPSLELFMKIQHVRKFKDDDGRMQCKVESLDPLYVRSLLQRMSASDCEVLDIARPEKLIISHMLVPPTCIRPSTTMGDAGTTEDDLTVILSEIADVNSIIQQQAASGFQTVQLLSNWEFLQLQCTRFINSEAPSVANLLAAKSITKPGRGVCQRLKGKEGRFRGNLSGKRVDYSGRTVISPDPNMGIDEVAVPLWTAKRMTYPDRVSALSLQKLKQAVVMGDDGWPGAAYVLKRDGTKCSLRYGNRRMIAENLQAGDVVMRHMNNGDIVLFNRQPSLHRMSIMAHRARVMPWRTFRFNECVCSPYNADFDGDEMNLHLPQTEEARAEAYHLMGVVNNLVTPKNGEPLIAATQDFLSGTYLLTSKDQFLTRDKFCQACCYFVDGMAHIDLPPPTILKPLELWTGKQVIGVLLRPNRYSRVMVNFELKERNYDSEADAGVMCREEGYVLFRDSELLAGALGKKVLGDTKVGLFFHLIRDDSSRVAAQCMGRLAKLAARWFSNKGMTIGIDDVTPGPKVERLKNELVENGYLRVEEELKNFQQGALQPNPGCTLEETLEVRVKSILDDLRNAAGKMCNANLPPLNKPLIMFKSGAKGALINIAQMISLVGQQNVSGQRIQNGFVARTLPHFRWNCKDAQSRGFVANSFYSGLQPQEFFFHTMSGREGLVDTAVKTAETGYMQRRLMKALEDLSVGYDCTVRTSDGQVVQFVYGDDGLAPVMMEDKNQPMSLPKVYSHINSLIRVLPLKSLYSPPRDTYAVLPPSDDSCLWPCMYHRYKESHVPQIAADAVLRQRASNRRRVGTALPRSLQQKLQALTSLNPSLHQYIMSTNSQSHPHPPPAWARYCSTNLSSSSFEDRVVVNLLAFFAVYDWLPLPAQHCPLTPFEIRAWTDYLLPHVAELLPLPLRNHQLEALFNTGPTHQSGTQKVRVFAEQLAEWLNQKADEVADFRELCGMTRASEERDYWEVVQEEEQRNREERRPSGDLSSRERVRTLRGEQVYNRHSWVTVRHIYEFTKTCWSKYRKAVIEAGEAVGAVGAQSIGEPGTQMTLKTFHFAGVASMNVTLGVPRIKEIINAAVKIQTPIIQVPLSNTRDYHFAVMVKGRIEKTLLEDVCLYVKEVFAPEGCWLCVKLCEKTINNLFLDIRSETVKQELLRHVMINKVRLRENLVDIITPFKLHIRPPGGDAVYFQLQALKKGISGIVLAGLKDVKRGVINKEKTKDDEIKYGLAVEGYGLRDVMGITGVDGHHVTSNHVMEVVHVLGIEAARSVIINEIRSCMEAYSMDIDCRHMTLLGDVMTFRGDVLGISRFGIQKMRASTLMLASFEETNEHLFEAAVHHRQDSVMGVSESIIMGKHVSVGTGTFDILSKRDDLKNTRRRGSTLLSRYRHGRD